MGKLRHLLMDPRSALAAALVACLVWLAIGVYDTLLIEAMRPYLPQGSPTPMTPGGRLAKHLLLLPLVLLALHGLARLRSGGAARTTLAAGVVLCGIAIGVAERAALNLVGVLFGETTFEGMGFLTALHDWLTHDWRLVTRSVAQNAASFVITALALVARSHALEAMATQRRAAAIELDALKLRLAALENELSPHFLFNALHHAVARTGDLATRARLVDLSDLLRFVLRGRDQPLVTLDEELEFSRQYLQLCEQQGATVAVTWSVAPEAGALRVPRMLVHMLVENAYRHAGEVAPIGSIVVEVKVDGPRLRIAIENDHRPGADLAGTGIGLRNARERLEILFPGRAAVVAGPIEGRRWRTVVELPAERPA